MGAVVQRILLSACLVLMASGVVAPLATAQKTAPIKKVPVEKTLEAKTSEAGTLSGGDAVAGAKIYERKCEGCHSLDVNSVGPSHRGVVGRRAGSVPGFAYSKALLKSNLVWTEANLDLWLQNPPRLVPMTRMGLQLSNATERQNVIAYLREKSSPKR